MVVDVGDDESFAYTGTGQNSVRLDAHHLNAAADIQLTAQLRACIGELATQNLDHIDIFPGQ